MKKIYNPYPNIAFNYKFIASILNNAYTKFEQKNIDYDLIKKCVLGYPIKANKETRKIKNILSCFYEIHIKKSFLKAEVIRQFDYYFDKKIDIDFLEFMIENLSSNKTIFVKISVLLARAYNLDYFHYIYALIIATHLIQKEYDYYYVFSNAFTKDMLNELISENIMGLAIYLEGKTMRLFKCSKKFSRQDIQNYFSNNYSDFLDLNLNQIRVYGSYYKHMEHRESDIDLLVEFDEGTSIIQRRQYIGKIKEIVRVKLHRRCDIQDLSSMLNDEKILESLVVWNRA